MTEVLQWIDPDGVTATLEVEWEVRGRFMPKIETQVDEVPGQPGGLLRAARHGIREFMVVVWQQAAGEAALRTALRNFVDTMDPTRGLGKLRVTSPLGDQREITCQYATGLDLDETLGESSGPDSQKIPLGFVAYDPYWYDVSTHELTFTLGAPVSFFPILPIHLSTSEIVAESVIVNGGSVETWPLWTITGPGSLVRLVNVTTGQFLEFSDLELGAGQVITIDTRPGVKSVVLDDGTNLYPLLGLSSSLWPLRRGTNVVQLEMSGSTADTSLRVSYWHRYLSP